MEMWQGIMLAVITAAASIYGAAKAGKSSVKVKQLDVESQAYIRADGITAGLLKTLRAELDTVRGQAAKDKEEYKSELKKRDDRLDAIEREIDNVRDHNNELIAFAYRMIALARKYGYDNEIPSPAPNGIHL